MSNWGLRSSALYLVACMGMFGFSTWAHSAVEISEFVASNGSGITDEDGEREDWIEIYNNTNAAVNLSGWYLTDDAANLTQWALPAVNVPARQYLVVFASGKDRTGATLHTNFKLKSGGEYLALVRPNGTTVEDEYTPEYPQQYTDISYGGDKYYPTPTPGAANSGGVDGVLDPVEFDLAHGVFNSPQTLTMSAQAGAGIRYTLDGTTPPGTASCEAPADGKAWNYSYYEGVWSVLPDFSQLNPVASGTSDTITHLVRQRLTDYGLRFTGCINVPVGGEYAFRTTSDDGSRLYVNGAMVVNNDGLHGPRTITGTTLLEAGLHEITVDFFQHLGGDVLTAEWNAPHRGNSHVQTADLGNIYSFNAGSADVVEIPFEIPAAGNYVFEAHVRGLSADSDSFFVQLNNGSPWVFHTGVQGGISAVNVSDNGSLVTASLPAGNHVLRFFVREDGTQLDAVVLRGSNCDGPCEVQRLEAEAGAFAGLFHPAGRAYEAIEAAKWFTYSSPLNISQTSVVKAVAVRNNFLPPKAVTATYLFPADVVQQSPQNEAPEGWPQGPVNSQQLDYGMDPDVVNPNPNAVVASLNSLPSISITMDVDDLMHPQIGIFTNANNKGRYWEREATFELIDATGNEPGFTKDGGIRIRGGFSRSGNNRKHAFRAFFRGSYDGDLEYPLFGDAGVDQFEKIDFRSSQNYSWAFGGNSRNTLLREVWSRDSQRDMGLPHTRSRYYHLYLNGVYWGVFMTQERVSKEFAKSYFGGNTEDYDVVKHNRSHGYRYQATDGNNAAWNRMFDLVADQQITNAEYQEIDAAVDLENLIDYFLINVYEGDRDGSPSGFLGFTRGNNWYGIKDRNNPDSKWTFYQHDGEHSLGVRRDQSFNYAGPFPPFNGQSSPHFNKEYMQPYWLHAALVGHPEYRQRFKDRVAQRLGEGGALSDAAGLARWLARKSQVEGAILAHSARWGDTFTAVPRGLTEWQAEVAFVENTFFNGRAEVVRNLLVAQNLANRVAQAALSLSSGSVVTPGTDVVVQAPAGATVYYTLDGTDPRASGGSPAAGALTLQGGQSITVNQDVTIVARVFDQGEWGAPATATYSVNAIPEITPVDNQFSIVNTSASLSPVATDDDVLTWDANGLPTGLSINSSTGQISGTTTQTGLFDVTLSVNDGSVTVEETFSWQVSIPAPLILNEFNAVSGSRYLGGGDGTTTTPADTSIGRIAGNGGDWFELVVIQDNLDIRGWQLSIVDDGQPDTTLVFSNAAIWSDLRAGTIITVAEDTITTASGVVLAEDISFNPASDDWWIHVVAGSAGSGAYITASNFKVSNKDWQLEILDGAGNPQFGPAGEGVGALGGVSSEEVGKLEEDPSALITAGSAYNDGTSSTLGQPNLFGGGTQTQDFSALRAGVSIDPVLSVSDTTVSEGGFLRFGLSLSQPANQDVSFELATLSGTATAGTDFGVKQGVRVLPQGQTQMTIWIQSLQDTDVEGDETMQLELRNLSGAVPGDVVGMGTILDDDTGVMLPVLDVADAVASEGGFARFEITLSQASATDVSFVLANVDQTAVATDDFLPKTGRRFIPAGETSKIIWVTTVDDSVSESSETFTLQISDPVGAVLGDASGVGTILDNDGGVAPTLNVADASAVEGEFARFVLSLTQSSTSPVTFNIATPAVSATLNDDYTPKQGQRTIPAGESQITIWIPTFDDLITEGSETFELRLDSVSGALAGDTVGVGTIVDNDLGSRPDLSITDGVGTEGGAARLVVSLTQALTVPVNIVIQTEDISAVGDVDYDSKAGGRVIPAGQTELVLWVPLPDDILVEGDETFYLRVLSADQANLVDDTAIVTIRDND